MQQFGQREGPETGRVVAFSLQKALEQRRQELEDFFENAVVALHLVAGDGTIIRANQAELDLLGYTAEEYIGRNIADFHADQHVIRDIVARLGRGERIDQRPARLKAKDGSIRHVLISSNAQIRDGELVHTRCFTIDVTEQKRADEALRQKERWATQLLDALPAAIYTTDAAGRLTFFNRAAAELAGREPVLGKDEWCVTFRLREPDGTPLPHERCPMAIALRTGEPVRGIEALAERPDGQLVPFLPFPTPLRDEDGVMVGAVNMLVDISEQKAAEARQKRLIDELNHRVKNALATVQSIAAQTVRTAESLETFKPAFEGRLMALSRAHDVLTRRQWEGATLHDLLGPELTGFSSADLERVQLEGPLVTLPPRISVALALALHELASNAAAHGALAQENGRLRVGWRVERRQGRADLALTWSEAGARDVRAPARPGFGLRMVERTVVEDLGGVWDLSFGPDGVCCGIRVPLDQPKT